MAAVPAETIDSWVAASPPLDPRRLMPALMRAEGRELHQRPRAPQADALRYVQFCISRLGSTDPTVHNLAVRAPHHAYVHTQRSSRAAWRLLQ